MQQKQDKAFSVWRKPKQSICNKGIQVKQIVP